MNFTELVNGIIDQLLSTADRLLQLPMYSVLAIVAALAVGLGFVLLLLSRRRPRLRRVLWFGESVLVLALLLWLLDRRLSDMQAQINELRLRLNTPREAVAAATTATAPARAFLFDRDAVERGLGDLFGDHSLRPMVCDAAADFVQVRLEQPLAMVYVAIVDLKAPGLAVELGTNLTTKTLTSAFARERRCVVAINGEAGNSPRPDSGFGPWTGHFVEHGVVLMREKEGNPHPFLIFDTANHGGYRAAAAADRTVPAGAANVIWGRWDLIVDGEVQLGDLRSNQPRTAMGLDKSGDRLLLMVVDGRQPRASWGFTRAEAGTFLKLFGAENAMLCDEGGSSCMFVDAFGGIVNTPSDNQGDERPTYTHFGVSRAR